MGQKKKTFLSRRFGFFSLIQVPPMWQAETSGGQMMSFIDKPTACFLPIFALTYPPIYRHCSHTQPYQTNGDVKRTEETESRSDFLRLETERFRCGDSLRSAHFPFDVRRRNDTNCIWPLWNTISGWRDGEHIHLLTWSFKRKGLQPLSEGTHQLPFLIRAQKGKRHRQQLRALRGSEWADLQTRWSHQDVD